jgi:hypothetical protein
MTQLAAAPTAAVEIEGTARPGVDWGAVLAGAFLAAALSFVLLTFGAAIGLSATSPWPDTGLSTKVIASLAVFWTLAQQIGTFMLGGYVAGRLAARWHTTDTAESEFRDGLHGALVWAIAISFAAFLAMVAGGALMRSAADTGARTAASVSAAGAPMEATLDTMLRTSAGTPAQGTAPGTAQPTNRVGATASESRAELSRLLARSVATGGLSDSDRAYLSQRISQLTGLSQQEADSRINTAITEARRAADTARRAAVLTGLVTAVSLLVSLAAAWWAAVKGGQHRDNAIPPNFGIRPFRRPVAPAN